MLEGSGLMAVGGGEFADHYVAVAGIVARRCSGKGEGRSEVRSTAAAVAVAG